MKIDTLKSQISLGEHSHLIYPDAYWCKSRKTSGKSSPKSSPKTEEQILALIRKNPSISAEILGETLEISKRAILKQIEKLKAQNRLRRVGPANGGHWELP